MSPPPTYCLMPTRSMFRNLSLISLSEVKSTSAHISEPESLQISVMLLHSKILDCLQYMPLGVTSSVSSQYLLSEKI
jgi:hypothetical protein